MSLVIRLPPCFQSQSLELLEFTFGRGRDIGFSAALAPVMFMVGGCESGTGGGDDGGGASLKGGVGGLGRPGGATDLPPEPGSDLAGKLKL